MSVQSIKEVQQLKRHLKNTHQGLDKIIIGRKELLEILSKEIAVLDELATDVQICKVSGGVAGTVGTGLVVGGLVASFFTFGASLAVSLVGAGVGASGAIVASGASIADAVISKKKRKIINELLVKDANLIRNFENLYQGLEVSFNVLSNAKTVVLETKMLARNAIRFLSVADVAIDAGRTAFGMLRGAAKGFALAGAVFSIITLPLDIHMIVANSIDIHEGKKHEISKELHKFEDEIRKELVSMEAMKAEFVRTEKEIFAL